MDPMWGTSHFEIAWGWPIALYLFLAGISAGAFITAGLTEMSAKDGKYHQGVVKAGAYLAPILIIIGLGLLVIDLGRPLSFWLLLIKVNPTSVMSVGVFILSLYSIISVIYLFAIMGEARGFAGAYQGARSLTHNSSGRRFLIVAGVILALATGSYTGFLLTAIASNPLWGIPLLPVLFLVSALSTGLAACILLAKPEQEESLVKYEKADMALIVAELFILFSLFMGFGLKPGSQDIMAYLFSGSYGAAFWIGIIGFGLLAPLVIEWRSRKELHHRPFLAPALVLVGGMILRLYIVYGGQTLPTLVSQAF